MEQIAFYLCMPKARARRESCCRFEHPDTHVEQRHSFLGQLQARTIMEVSLSIYAQLGTIWKAFHILMSG